MTFGNPVVMPTETHLLLTLIVGLVFGWAFGRLSK